jgi:type II secretory pathway predicted ATPase ExeA/cell division septation protein DedD
MLLHGAASMIGGDGMSASLTYEPYYGLREKPFSLSADPRFLFKSPSHAPAFDALLAGIRRREGLIVLTGEIGTGKTTLCRSVLDQLDRRTFSAFVPDPFVSREDLLKTLLVDFGVIAISDLTRGRFNGASRSDLSYPLYEFLDSLVPLQAFAVLVIDEAQNLSLPLLEEIRILSELERREKLLQVVLVGQPELRSNLKLPQMRQVEQRVSVRCELTPLDGAGTAGYVRHRLSVAGGGESRVEFTEAALEAVFRGSCGVPRLINRICDRSLERAYVPRSLRIDAPFVLEAIDDLGLSPAQRTDDHESIEEPPSLVAFRPQLVDAVPAPFPVPAADLESTQFDATPLLSDFAPEVAPPSARPTPAASSEKRHPWVAGAVASLVAFSVSLAGVAWYLRTQTVEATVVEPALPLRPPVEFAALITATRLAPATAANPPQAVTAVPPANAPHAQPGGYSIVVASFASRARAERLVEELTSAGFRATAVERDWGPPRGRLVQVNVGGYASAIDVQRDLERIRQLPGGYNDARIVERN